MLQARWQCWMPSGNAVCRHLRKCLLNVLGSQVPDRASRFLLTLARHVIVKSVSPHKHCLEQQSCKLETRIAEPSITSSHKVYTCPQLMEATIACHRHLELHGVTFVETSHACWLARWFKFEIQIMVTASTSTRVFHRVSYAKTLQSAQPAMLP